MLTEDRLVPTKVATARLGIDRSTLARMVQRAEIKKVKFRHAARYSLADLDAFIERNTVQPVAGR